MSLRVLVTRPKDEAKDYANELQAQGFESLLAPMLDIVSIPFEIPSDFDALIFTSAQGVRVYVDGGGAVIGRVFCVGKYTARAACDAGFDDVVDVRGTGADIVDFIVSDAAFAGLKFLHIGGRHVAFPIAEALCQVGLSCVHVPVYEARTVDEIPANIVCAIRESKVDVVTFFSKRTAENFLDLIGKNGLSSHLDTIKCLSISDAVIECVRLYKYEWSGLYVSLKPDRAGMLEQLKQIEGEV
ncbi:MAG: uroporphyrinogen-III synthase [Alphaproteobacteria bacterium]